MKGFLRVVSLFGLPLAVIIWYDLYANTAAYQQTYGSRASRAVAIGIYLLTAFLCLHLPLRLWRRFDAMSLRLFCLTGSLATFWVAARLATSGRIDQAPLLKTAAAFLIPVGTYVLLNYFLFKWSRNEFADNEADSPDAKSVGGSTGDNSQPQTAKTGDEHGDF